MLEHENLVRDNTPASSRIINGGEKVLLSRDCDGCSQMRTCGRRYEIVEKGDRVYCPDGTVHLVDGM